MALTDPNYKQLDVDSVKQYLYNLKDISEHLGGDYKQWKIREVGDGNLNFVYVVEGVKSGLIVKQAVPFIRLVPSWPLTTERMFYEHETLAEEYKVVPHLVPKPYHFDKAMSLIVMEYLQDHILLRTGLIKATVYPQFAEHIAEFIAKTLFYTSDLYLSSEEKKKKVAVYSRNVLAHITEQVIFTEPYIEAKNNRHTKPQLDDEVIAIRNDSELKVAISQLKDKFQNVTEALVHGDLHTGSVMVTQEKTSVIDAEFSYFGPIGFDTGAILGNFLLSFYSQDGLKAQDKEEKHRDKYKVWLLEQVEKIWNNFVKFWLELWNTEHKGDGHNPGFWKDDKEGLQMAQTLYIKRIFADSIGFAGAKMLRRIVGVAHVADFEEIKDPNTRAKCEHKALALAKKTPERKEPV